MFVFVGKAEHNINKDGRLSIPSKMRDVIKKNCNVEDLYLILMPPENIICLYPGEEFEKLISKIDNLAESALSEIMEMERVCADAEPCKLDSSGRIIIPPKMREDAKIDQEVLVIGATHHIEIWDPKHWEYWSRRRNRSGIEKLRTL